MDVRVSMIFRVISVLVSDTNLISVLFRSTWKSEEQSSWQGKDEDEHATWRQDGGHSSGWDKPTGWKKAGEDSSEGKRDGHSTWGKDSESSSNWKWEERSG